ncbi:hypothetical protein HDA32_000294 [Spinactinospora alkalitolerans]|uniref:DUF4190 domain-containing protein n=1 Tax=Spinactinospora alkalitolerans TaxID=687207 RepID=A0A852TSR7_9ACTN|nr:hypothetical protein [Spinactinospora alkalitolerans]NYE45174.1 hypothetical protein [Spinactinospora alkalitolerans]
MSNQWPDPPDYWGGQPQQPGWGGGYGQPSGAWQSGGYPQPGYPPYGPPGPPGPPPAKGGAITALVIAILTTVTCCTTNIIGIVFAAIALSKDKEPDEFEKFTRWAWICNFIHIGLAVAVVVFFLIMISLEA